MSINVRTDIDSLFLTPTLEKHMRADGIMGGDMAMVSASTPTGLCMRECGSTVESMAREAGWLVIGPLSM